MKLRILRAIACAAAAAALALTWHGGQAVAQSGVTQCGIDLRVLVVSATGDEADLPAITQALDYLGTPYHVYIATQQPGGLTPAKLANGCHALYQGVILTTDSLAYTAPGGSWVSALTPAEFQALADYETSFGIRQVTWYTYPNPALGFNVSTGATGAELTAHLTPSGAQTFPYLNPAIQLPIQFSWTYLATPLDAQTTPLLTDAEGNALAAVRTFPDGRQNLAMTFDSNPYMLHAKVLSYGIINWVTKGLFVGERHAYMSPQIDDVFLDNTLWLSSTPCGTHVDSTGVNQRITGADLTAIANWQTARHAQALTPDVRLTMAFNGVGTTNAFSLVVGQNDTLVGGATSGPTTDTLTQVAQARQQEFFWVSHTFNHENLDAVSQQTATSELAQNNAAAIQLGFTNYTTRFLVQPDVSGLGNPNFLSAAYNSGLWYLLSDTSKPGQGNPSPNVGFWNTLGQPGIFVIPRRANNLFFNVTTPTDWAAEYNCLYNAYWGRNLNYSEILEQESGFLLSYLLRGELDPWMFHQANLAAYDGVNSVLTDLLDRTVERYGSYLTVPIISPSIDVIGERMKHRTTMRTSGISARVQPGVGLVLKSPVAVTVPVTGIQGPSAEFYAGQWISWVTLEANVERVLPYTAIERPTVSAGPPQTVNSGAAVTVAATAIDPNSPALPLTYAWRQTAGPAVTLTNVTSPAAGFSAPIMATGATPVSLDFTVSVSNGTMATEATTTVTVMPVVTPPVVNAGAPQTVASAVAVALTGTASDANVPALPLTYLWTQTAGPAVTLTNAQTAIAGFTAPTLTIGMAPVTLGFTLTVSNGPVAATATTIVTVNPPIGPPIANAAAASTVAWGAAVTLTGSATDPNLPVRPLTYAWTQTAGPTVALTNATAPVATFTAPMLGPTDPPVMLSFALTVGNGVYSSVATVSTTVVKSFAVVGQTVFSDGVGTRTTPAFPVLAGDLIVAFVSADGPTTTQTATVSGAGLTWTLARRVTTQRGTSEVWSAVAGASASSATVTATLSQAAFPASLTVVTFSGAGGLGVSAGANALTGAPSVSLTTTRPGSLVYGVGNDWDRATPRTAGSGQSLVHEYLGSSSDSHWVQTLTSGAVGPAGTVVQLNDTAPTNDRWNYVAVEVLDGQTTKASPTGLVAAFGFSEGTGGAVADSSGAMNNGTINGAARTQAGRFGDALSFDGISHAITIPDSASLDLTTAMTLEAWVKPTSLTGWQTVLYKERPEGTGTALAWSLYSSDSTAPPAIYAATPANPWNHVTGTSMLALNTWAHIAGTYDGAMLRIYVNGVLSRSVASTGAMPVSSGPLRIGGHAGSGQYFNGLIDEVRVYNRALSQNEIRGDMNAKVLSLPAPTAPVVDAGAAQTVAPGVGVVLAGTASDPNVPVRPLTYQWSQTGGTPVVLTAPEALATTFTAPSLAVGSAPETLTFMLTANNGAITTQQATTVTVTVGAPIVSTGAPQTVASAAAVSLTGAASDPNLPALPLTYTWAQTGGASVTLLNATTLSASFTAPTLTIGVPAETLTFTLTAHNGTTSTVATTTVTVTPPVGAPVVTAGAAQTVASAAAVSLTGSATDPNVPALPLTYAWAQTGGPSVTLLNGTALGASFTAPALAVNAASETLTFALTANNGTTSTVTTTTVTVTAPLGAPLVDAGAAQTVASAAAVSLTGTASDPNLPALPLTYTWAQTGGASVTLLNATTLSASFTAPTLAVGAPAETLTFALTAHNGTTSTLATTTVTVTAPLGAPVVSVGTPQTVASAAAVSLTGSATDPNVPALPLTYAWAQTGGPSVTLLNDTTPSASFTAPTLVMNAANETLTFTLTASNGTMSTVTTATVTVTAPLGAPLVDAGAAQTVASAASVALTGTASDPNLPALPLTYTWTQTGGASVTLLNATTLSASFTAPALAVNAASETLTFALTASNGTTSTVTTTTVTVTAPLGAPLVDAGAAQTVASAAAVSLTGAASDPNLPALPLTYTWTQTGGASVTLLNATTLSASFTAPTLTIGVPAETLTFTLTAHNGTTSTVATTTVTVTPPIGAPVVTTDPTQTVASAAAVALTGSATDPNVPALPLTYAWAQTGGPSVTLLNGTALGASFTAPALAVNAANETLTFTLTASNGTMSTVTTTTVTVTAPLGAPLVDAGAAQTVASAASVALTGAASDPNLPALPLTYTWAQTGGASVTLLNATTLSASFTAPTLAVGAANETLTFTLTAHNGTTSTLATTTVTVTPPIGAPVVTTAATQTVASAATVSLTGTASDPNVPARPLTYTWAQTAGPSVTLLNATTLSASFTAPTLAAGAANETLTFTVTVGNGVLTTVKTTTVTVTAPVAGLVAAFGFNEGSGGSVADRSGIGNNGTLAGAAWSTAGRFGNALSFNGTNSTVTIADAASLDLTTGMTLEAWVRPTSLTGWRTVLYKERPDGAGTGLAYSLYASDDNAPPAIYAGRAADPWSHVTGSSMLPVNAWTHIAGTYDGTTLRIYVNGVLVKTSTKSGSMFVTAGLLRIGGHAGSGQYFSGLIDEVRVYNRALTQSQIQTDMNAPVQ